MIVASAFVVLVGTATVVFASYSLDELSRVGSAGLAIVPLTGFAFLFRAVVEFRRGKEWEFCANRERICWLMRDQSGEKVEGEVELRQIRALIYHGGDADSSPYLDIESIDGIISPFPSRGLISGPDFLAFINYWRAAHREIPIKNLSSD